MEAACGVAVILPVYNEADILLPNVRRLREFLAQQDLDYRIVLCDDCSTDATPSRGERLAAEDPRTTYFRFHRRIGKGGTIKNAIRVVDARAYLVLDADLPVDLDRLPSMVAAARATKGLVVATRRVRTWGAYNRTRRLLSLLFNALVRMCFATGIKDHQMGCKAIEGYAAKVLAREVRVDGFLFDTELVVAARRRRLPIHLVELPWVDRRAKGGSKVAPFRTALTMFIDLMALRASRVGERVLLPVAKRVDGGFTDARSALTHPIEQLFFDTPRRGFFDLARNVYWSVAGVAPRQEEPIPAPRPLPPVEFPAPGALAAPGEPAPAMARAEG